MGGLNRPPMKVVTSVRLELNPSVQLNHPARYRRASERSVDAGRSLGCRRNSAERGRVNVVYVIVRYLEIRMVEDVVEVCSDCEVDSLRNFKAFQQIQIRVEEVRAAERVPPSCGETGVV